MIQGLKHTATFLFLFMVSVQINAQEAGHGFVNMKDSSKSIPPVYGSASGFSEGLAAVKKGDKWGYIDVSNKVVIDFQFDYARSFKHGRAIVLKGDFYGVINKEGEFVIPPHYYDLIAYELEGRQHYISRDSTFFQGIIDTTGKEILPHRYSYIITYGPNLSKQRFYKNIPFYTVFQTIDTTKGNFYEQFKEDAYQFSPEKGRHDIYDLQFNKLASRNSTSYTDGFQHDKLRRIDNFLTKNTGLAIAEKIKEIDNLLSSPKSGDLDTIPRDTAYLRYGTMSDDGIEDYLADLGYTLFINDGKTGLKKGGNVIIPAKNKFLKLLDGVISAPSAEDIPFLETHYGGRYRNKEKGIYDIFAVVPHNGEPNNASKQYSLSGVIKLPVREVNKQGRKIISQITPLGFLYLHTTTDLAGKKTKTYSLVNWKGKELFPPVYREIEVLRSGHVLVTQQKEVGNGIEEHFGLFDSKGKAIIPLGVYSGIKPFDESVDNLYLATLSDFYPTMEEKKAARYENKDYVILNVIGITYTVTNRFVAGQVSTSALDVETGMLPYHQYTAGTKGQK